LFEPQDAKQKNILQGWLDSTVPFIKAKKKKVDKVRLALRAVLNKFGSITDFNINKNIFLSINYKLITF